MLPAPGGAAPAPTSAFCAATTFSFLPAQAFIAGSWIARANENASGHGSAPPWRTCIALRRADASGADCPPDRNAMPPTAAGTLRRKTRTVASATSSTLSCVAHFRPGTTMLGLRIMPSSSTRCVASASNTTCSARSVTSAQRASV